MYDLVIIGAGPAGLTASIYASCYHLSHIVIGKELGGQLRLAPDILNYPGFSSIAGTELIQRMVDQVKTRGGEIIVDSVVKINKANYFEVETQSGQKYEAKAIILASGTERRKLNVPGEVEYTSKGVHYCATCEKLDYEGKICAVVGGANSALQAAVELFQAAAKVYIIYRGSQLRGDPIWLEQVDIHPNIEVIYNTVVIEIIGDKEKVTGVKLKSISNVSNSVTLENNETMKPRLNGIHDAVITHSSQTASGQWNNELLPLDKLFIEIGGVPGTALVIPLGVEVDAGGFIKVNERLETNMAGIFAAGDLVTFGYNLEQISSAVGLGARAAASAFAFLKGDKPPTVWGGSTIKR